MVNWVTRRDVSEAAKGGAGIFALAFLVVLGLALGAWWWVNGEPLYGEPSVGLQRRLIVVGRVSLFVGFFALAYAPGAMGWVGAFGVLALVIAGFATARRGEA